MRRMRTKLKTYTPLVLILLVLILATAFISCTHSSISANAPVSVSYGSDTMSLALPSTNEGWTSFDIEVVNNINDYSFSMPAYYMFNVISGQWDIRVMESDITDKSHYFEQSGYTYNENSFSLFTKSSDGTYYSASFKSFDNVKLTVNYTSVAFIVNFIDDLTGETISSLTVSKGGSLNPPTAPDHLNDGYVFVGWSGGSAENVQRNTTLYATYAPVRYVTIVLPDGSKNEIKVAFGSKLSDIEVPEFEGRKFDCWSSSSSITDKLSNDISIMYDTTIYAVYQSYWWIALIVLAVIMVVVIVIVIIKTR